MGLAFLDTVDRVSPDTGEDGLARESDDLLGARKDRVLLSYGHGPVPDAGSQDSKPCGTAWLLTG